MRWCRIADRKLRCLVCGRVFYEGQGVKISAGGMQLVFHSKSCAIKFVRSMLLYLDPKDLENAVKLAVKEFEERLKELEELRKKRIESL